MSVMGVGVGLGVGVGDGVGLGVGDGAVVEVGDGAGADRVRARMKRSPAAMPATWAAAFDGTLKLM